MRDLRMGKETNVVNGLSISRLLAKEAQDRAKSLYPSIPTPVSTEYIQLAREGRGGRTPVKAGAECDLAPTIGIWPSCRATQMYMLVMLPAA